MWGGGGEGGRILKEHLEDLDFSHSWIYNKHKKIIKW